MYWKALVIKPPLQPLFPYIMEQSTRFCALKDTSFPVFSFTWASRAPTALKAQHDPQAPYKSPSEAQALSHAAPAWTRMGRASHLVLHLRDTALLSPVHGVRDAAAWLPLVHGGPVVSVGNFQPSQQSRHFLTGLRVEAPVHDAPASDKAYMGGTGGGNGFPSS